jgi:uncharacterized protein YbaP (TraB family)
MKRIIPFILFLLLISFIAAGCGQKDKTEQTKKEKSISEKYGEYTPNLWVIEKDNKKIYLFGSIHVGYEEMYPLPDYVLEAFNNSSVLAVENDIVKLQKDGAYFANVIQLISDETPIKNRLNQEEYNDLKNVFRDYGSNIELISNYKPLFYFMELTNLMVAKIDDLDYKYGVDEHLIKSANSKNMQIKDIEDPLYAYTHLFALPYEVQIFLLNTAIQEIKNGEQGEEDLDKMLKAWVNGTLADYFDEEEQATLAKYTPEELDYFEQYNKVMMDDRNHIMADKVIEYLNTDQVHFYVVGAAHYPGETGILQLLKDRGYEVREITPGK